VQTLDRRGLLVAAPRGAIHIDVLGDQDALRLEDKTVDILNESFRVADVLGIECLEHQTNDHQRQHLLAHIHAQRKLV